MLKAVLFDLDGVITDSTVYHYQAWKKLADELSIDFDSQYNEKLKGVSRMASLELILIKDSKKTFYTNEEKLILATKKNQYYQELIKQITTNDILPGIIEFLIELKEKKVKTVVCSASRNAFTIINSLGLNDYFDHIIDASYIVNAKPANDVFTVGAYIVGAKPNEVVGIEDAKAGITAIKKAGFKAIGVGTKEQMIDADLLLKSTRELNFKKVSELVK
jgi:beta-phosphoglucomutase